MLRDAETVVLTLPALCEFVWVASRGYRRQPGDIAAAVRQLVNAPTVVVDRPAVEAGLSMLVAGGDFADGIIAFDGRCLGGSIFASFGREAVGVIAAQGGETRLLGVPVD